MKFMENMKKERKDNRGFSLVELIIVIAIMAILVGIVGTQVIPYLNRSRESKDQQILNSFSTAAVSAYSLNIDDISGIATSATATAVNVYDSAGASTEAGILADAIIDLTGYDDISDVQDAMTSDRGSSIEDVRITFDPTNHTITVIGVGADGITDIGIAGVESVI